MKRIIALILSCIICYSCASFDASATTDDYEFTRSGWSQQTIYINGTPYTATFSVEGNVSTGGRTSFATNARCVRNHYTVYVTYSTVEAGNEIYSGGAVNYKGEYSILLLKYLGVSGTTKSNPVYYGGTATPTNIYHINGTGRLKTVNQDGTEHKYNFSAGV